MTRLIIITIEDQDEKLTLSVPSGLESWVYELIVKGMLYDSHYTYGTEFDWRIEDALQAD